MRQIVKHCNTSQISMLSHVTHYGIVIEEVVVSNKRIYDTCKLVLSVIVIARIASSPTLMMIREAIL